MRQANVQKVLLDFVAV